MKFRKRVRIFPGFTINLSGSGISSTIGVPGASINFGKNGAFLNTGIPGTGLYDRTRLNSRGKDHNSDVDYLVPNHSPAPDNPLDPNSYDWLKKLSETNEIKSSDISGLTSVSQEIMKEIIEDVYLEKSNLKKELITIKAQLSNAKFSYGLARVFIIGFFVKSFKEKVTSLQEYLEDLQKQLDKCFINIDIQFDEQFKMNYSNMLNSFTDLISSKRIWDVTSSKHVDQFTTRSAASSTITRESARFNISNIDIIQSEHQALHFENKNGGDIYIYPSFTMVLEKSGKFALIDIKDFQLTYSQQRFIETESIPSDSKIIDYTWEKVNKNGQPDRRFRDNRKLPIVGYGEISLRSNTGVNEEYMISSEEKAKKFAEAYLGFQKTID